MKRLNLVLLVLLGGLLCRAQDVLEFHAHLSGKEVVPPSDSTAVGEGSLTLAYGTLSGSVWLPYPFPPDTGAYVRGPAAPGEVGAILFSLGQQQKDMPWPPYSWGSTFYTPHLALTPAQADQLKAGLWYIEISTESHPGGEVRGQILLVPEPPTAALGVVGGVLLWCWSARRRVRPPRDSQPGLRPYL